jgi:hypothetical protein
MRSKAPPGDFQHRVISRETKFRENYTLSKYFFGKAGMGKGKYAGLPPHRVLTKLDRFDQLRPQIKSQLFGGRLFLPCSLTTLSAQILRMTNPQRIKQRHLPRLESDYNEN